MNRYVLGFAFDGTSDRVLLVKKLHGPSLNIGTLNGIGGKIEDGETDADAMVREFREETSCNAEWIRIGLMVCHTGMYQWEVVIFKALSLEGFPLLRNDVGEPIEWDDVSKIISPESRCLYSQNVPLMVFHAAYGEGSIEIKIEN